MPKFIKFNGTGNLLQHLNHYTQNMTLEAHNDLFMCKIFPSSLKGVALEWFKNRLCKSIPNFESLCVAFLAQYCENKKQKKTIASLFTIRQMKGEGLQAFLTRFNMESSGIPDCNQDTAIEVFKIAMVQGSRFHFSLVKKTSTNMSELNSRLYQTRRKRSNQTAEGNSGHCGKPTERTTEHLEDPARTPSHRKMSPREEVPAERVTPLKVTLAGLYQETKVRNIFQILPPIRQPMEQRD
ncbi:uncharacterized protein LOC132270095 [Cornus florida]|uniref:uncharacterized protein LOC132270095 n=1 Tax=Cornus florida TaxID=4283 RepID=UPI00289FEDDD|nr:uncharacterized protein LOC132270095 [Cornus florida]